MTTWPIPLRSLSRLNAVLLALIASCGGEDTVTGPESVAGVYALQTVNNATLPYLKEAAADLTVQVVSGSLTLRADATYHGEIIEEWARPASTDSIVELSNGSFNVSGNSITFAQGGNHAVYQGTITGNRITATLSDVTFGFVKR